MIYKEPHVVAEICCNHQGNIDIAKKMIETAASGKATVAKFQKRNNKEFLTDTQYNTPHPNKMHSFGDSYGLHREFLEFNIDQHNELKLYAESLGTEMGFYKDPYSKFGQLTYEMWRAVRLVVDTGMQYFGWSRDEAINYFAANTPKSRHDIEVEIDRYISWPGQALAYKIGELKFKDLRRRATETLGDKFDIREFHDELHKKGALPLDILDEQMNNWLDQKNTSVM